LAILVVAFAISGVSFAHADTAVQFTDSNLKSAVVAELNQDLGLSLQPGDTVWASQMAQLTRLTIDCTADSLNPKPISDLTGLETATGLVSLDIEDSSSHFDLTPIAGLGNLSWLALNDDPVSDHDLAEISSLPLTQLYLSGTQISDAGVTEIAVQWPNLVALDINDDSLIDNITPLATETGIHKLNVGLDGLDVTPGSNAALAIAAIDAKSTLYYGADPIHGVPYGDAVSYLPQATGVSAGIAVPTTTLTTNPSAPGIEGWFATQPSITLSTNVWVPYTYYEWGPHTTQLTYQGPLNSPNGLVEGSNTFVYWSDDNGDVATEAQNVKTLSVDTQAPPAPVASASSLSATSIRISWNGVTDLTPGSGVDHWGYEIYRDDGTFIAKNLSTSLQHNVFSLQPSTTYGFYVVAVDAAGNRSAPSNIAYATTPSNGGSSGGSILFWQQETPPPAPFVKGYGAVVGGKIYALGGTADYASNTLLSTGYCFDPGQNSWTTVPNISPASYGGGFCTYNNEIFVFGGMTSAGLSGPPTSAIYEYDPGSGTTRQVGSLAVARYAPGVAIVGNHAYIVGGQDASGAKLDTIEDFDLTQLGGTQTAAVLPYTLAQAVVRPIVFSDASHTHVYVFGGLGASGNLSSGQELDPNSGWMSPPSLMPFARSGYNQEANSNNTVYLSGGPNNTNEVQQYDITHDTWSLIGSMPQLGQSMMTIADGSYVYAINGWDAGHNSLTINEAAQIVPATAVGNVVGVNAPGTAVVSAGGSNVSVNFDQVTGGGGQVSVSTMPASSVPAGAGIGFSISGQVFDVATTVTGWNTLTITLPYTGAKTSVYVRHWTTDQNGVLGWQQLGPYPVVGGTVTFTTTSLSPFALEDAPTPTHTSTPASAPWSLAALALIAVAIIGAASVRARARVAAK
jgi:N-acetylneuraminic acid mutarotase